MSIQHASNETLASLKLNKSDIAKNAMLALSKVATTPLGQKRLDAIIGNFPGLLPAITDPRDQNLTDLTKFPYDNLQLYQQKDGERYYIAGDVHGDLETLVACADIAISECTQASANGCSVVPVLVILGDLIDRGPDSAECIAFLLRLALGKDEDRKVLRVLLVRGDHDVALRCMPDGRISAAVEPAEFAESFNSTKPREVASIMVDAALARCYMYFVRHCSPAAALFSEGVLMSHGAVPHTDLLNRFGMDLTPWSAPCAQDFVWARMCPEYRRRGPNRKSKTTDMGMDDFCDFITVFNKLAIFKQNNKASNIERVTVFIHGHQHCESGFNKAEIEIPDLGLCEIHNVTSFADCDSTGQIKAYPGLLKMEGRNLSAFVVETGTQQDSRVPDPNEPNQPDVAISNGATYNESSSTEDGCHDGVAQADVSDKAKSLFDRINDKINPFK